MYLFPDLQLNTFKFTRLTLNNFNIQLKKSVFSQREIQGNVKLLASYSFLLKIL